MIAIASFGLIAYLTSNEIFSSYLQINFVRGTDELVILCGAVIGAGLGFLWFNAPPAMVFMGDTDRYPGWCPGYHQRGNQTRIGPCHHRRSFLFLSWFLWWSKSRRSN